MVASGKLRLLGLSGWLLLPLVTALTAPQPVLAQQQKPTLPANNQLAPTSIEPDELRPLNQDSSLLSIAGGQRLVADANTAITARNYDLAVKKLQDARQIFSQLSNFSQQLSTSFAGIDTRVAEASRTKALETAKMRDDATYQLASVHKLQNQSLLSIPLLVQVIRSQTPNGELGKKAYDLLKEVGFDKQSYPNLLAEATNAVSANNYPLAIKKFQEARQVFNQLSNFYQQLSTSFSGIDNPVSEANRSKALETAQMRDDATYQLALAHRAQNQPELSLPLLIQIIRSQNPGRDLGQKAYQQLMEMGFVDNPANPSNTPNSFIATGQGLVANANTAIAAKNYDLAVKKFQEARQVFNQLSNFHQQLSTSFAGVDNRVSEANRLKALDTAQMRDEATYQLASVHKLQNQSLLSIPLLVQVIRSQNPTRDLGKKSYDLLQQLGFDKESYPNLLGEASNAISANNYPLAITKLQEARQVFNQLSNFYQQLAASFSGIDNKVSEVNRTKALETAQIRDDATYQLALVHRAQNEPELSVPLLIQVIRSQNPGRDLGKKAYQQLIEVGFVDNPANADRSMPNSAAATGR